MACDAARPSTTSSWVGSSSTLPTPRSPPAPRSWSGRFCSDGSGLGEPDPDFALGGLVGVRAVDEVERNLERVVAADRAGRRLERVRRADHLAGRRDGLVALENSGN